MINQDQEIIVLNSQDEIADYFCDQWETAGMRAVKERGEFAVALSGGQTPAPLYRRLATGVSNASLWQKTHVFLADERFVPPEHEDSNYRRLKENLFRWVRLPQNNVHYVPFIDSSTFAAELYTENLRHYFSLGETDIPAFDFILLGLGEDGHTASLFPSLTEEEMRSGLALAVHDPQLKYRRISLSLPVLNAARQLFFLVTGEQKAIVVKKILEQHNCELPASLVRLNHGRQVFVLDSAAAKFLKV